MIAMLALFMSMMVVVVIVFSSPFFKSSLGNKTLVYSLLPALPLLLLLPRGQEPLQSVEAASAKGKGRRRPSPLSLREQER